MSIFSRLHAPGPRLGTAVLILTVSLLSAGCARLDGSPDPKWTTAGLTRIAEPVLADPVTDPATRPRLRLELDDDESFVSVAASGELIITDRPDQLCLRSGSDFTDRECLPIDHGNASWTPTWSPDGERLAIVRAGSSRGGERNDSV